MFKIFKRKVKEVKDKCTSCGGKIEKAPAGIFGAYGICKRVCKNCGMYYFYD